MLKSGLAAGSLALPLLLGACGMFEGVSTTVERLAGAADKDAGSYKAPLAVPPDYDLRPPPARAEKKAEPASEPESQPKTPGALDTEPAAQDDTSGKAVPTKDARRSEPSEPGSDPKSEPSTRERAPQPLVIETDDEPKAQPKPEQKKVENRRQVVPPPPQPSETTGTAQPETRGREDTRTGDPTTGEDELLRRSGAKE